MRLVIFGSRNLHPDLSDISEAFTEAGYLKVNVKEIVSGAAAGVDQAGEEWAEFQFIPVKRFPADWKENGKAAGPIRNRQMAEYATHGLCFWNGTSKGTRNMLDECKKRNIPVYVVHVE